MEVSGLSDCYAHLNGSWESKHALIQELFNIQMPGLNVSILSSGVSTWRCPRCSSANFTWKPHCREYGVGCDFQIPTGGWAFHVEEVKVIEWRHYEYVNKQIGVVRLSSSEKLV